MTIPRIRARTTPQRFSLPTPVHLNRHQIQRQTKRLPLQKKPAARQLPQQPSQLVPAVTSLNRRLTKMKRRKLKNGPWVQSCCLLVQLLPRLLPLV